MDYIASLAPAAENYDAFLLDVWGVVHDGQALYEGVVECLENLRKKRKKIIFVSNAPRRAAKVVEGLANLGVTRGLFDHAVSSGELVHDALRDRKEAFFAGLGKRYYALTPDRDAGLLEGLPYRRVENMEEAEFLLALGFDDNPADTLEAKLPLLQEARALNLPMICANPDDYVVRITGEKRPCAGLMAEWYEGQGGMVRALGKPYPEVYSRCETLLGGIPKSRILAVGDNLRTDIKGGAGAGLDTCLVTGGVLKVTLAAAGKSHTDSKVIAEECARAGQRPHYCIPAFTW